MPASICLFDACVLTHVRAFLCTLVVAIGPAFAAAVPIPPVLTLAEAEQIALANAPRIAHHRSNADAAAARAIYEGQLPDPQLTLGAQNVPTDTFDLEQDDMTMTLIGVRQAFPPGRTRALKSERASQAREREEALLELEHRSLMREVRRTWLEMHALDEQLRIAERLRASAVQVAESAEGRFRAAQESELAVRRTRQAVAQEDDRLIALQVRRRTASDVLARWFGSQAAGRLEAALPTDPPRLPQPAAGFDATRHPEWRAARFEAGAARIEVAMAREAYKPGVMLDVQYGHRRSMPSGGDRPDMLTAMVSLDLPLFRAKRQDRMLAERVAMENAALLDSDDRRREIEARYATARTTLEGTRARVRLYEQRLLPLARQAARSAVAGSLRDRAERIEAERDALLMELEAVQLRHEHHLAEVEILYLAGEVAREGTP